MATFKMQTIDEYLAQGGQISHIAPVEKRFNMDSPRTTLMRYLSSNMNDEQIISRMGEKQYRYALGQIKRFGGVA